MSTIDDHFDHLRKIRQSREAGEIARGQSRLEEERAKKQKEKEGAEQEYLEARTEKANIESRTYMVLLGRKGRTKDYVKFEDFEIEHDSCSVGGGMGGGYRASWISGVKHKRSGVSASSQEISVMKNSSWSGFKLIKYKRDKMVYSPEFDMRMPIAFWQDIYRYDNLRVLYFQNLQQ